MAEAAAAEEVTAAFEKHLSETEAQVKPETGSSKSWARNQRARSVPQSMASSEGEEIIEQHEGTPAIDAGLVAAAQAVEHYEIARYGTLVAWAGVLKLSEAAEILQETLQGEEATDEALTELA